MGHAASEEASLSFPFVAQNFSHGLKLAPVIAMRCVHVGS
jgi:hypothetical protein